MSKLVFVFSYLKKHSLLQYSIVNKVYLKTGGLKLMKEMSQKQQKLLRGTCPSCHTLTNYTFLGIQHWPEEVARRLGVPIQQAMWQCKSCKTSVMEDSIVVEDIPNSA